MARARLGRSSCWRCSVRAARARRWQRSSAPGPGSPKTSASIRDQSCGTSTHGSWRTTRSCSGCPSRRVHGPPQPPTSCSTLTSRAESVALVREEAGSVAAAGEVLRGGRAAAGSRPLRPADRRWSRRSLRPDVCPWRGGFWRRTTWSTVRGSPDVSDWLRSCWPGWPPTAWSPWSALPEAEVVPGGGRRCRRTGGGSPARQPGPPSSCGRGRRRCGARHQGARGGPDDALAR